jgi:hypothetical protein
MPKKDATRIPIINRLITEEVADGNWLTDLFEIESRRYAPNRLANYLFNPPHIGVGDGILFNPPISFRQAADYHKAVGYGWDGRSSWWSGMKDRVASLIKEGGKCITIGWDSNGLGASRGFVMERILMVAHGGHWRDTIVTVESKPIF